MSDFAGLFRTAMADPHAAPYPYQQRLAEGPWPERVDVPTGLGKTAAITLAWLYRRGVRADRHRDAIAPGTPRRLVWCLPMRVLVEQTVANASAWLDRLGVLGERGAPGRIAVHTLMGGEPDLARAGWAAHPEHEAVLIGTQDMLLSRALMRGYGMSRYQWPVHYALLHNDALWIFDEVQLMGPALATSAQLEAFRRDLGTAAPAQSTWVSATLQPEWLDTVDFRRHRQQEGGHIALDEADRGQPAVEKRVTAPKTLQPAEVSLVDGTQKGQSEYARAVAREATRLHDAGTQTLVIVNRLERAQAIYDALADSGADRLLLHARFRPAERRAIEADLRKAPGPSGRIVVATQAIEAGVDIDSRILLTELAPWSSLVQRFGRCNRAGEYASEKPARVYWIEIDETTRDLALPYDADSLAAARERLVEAPSAAPADLPAVSEAPAVAHTLRRRDLLELFNTDPDLSGFDIDVSPYIRDSGTPQAQVYWRPFAERPDGDEPAPERDELCPVSVTQLADHLKKRKTRAWRRDPLAQASERAWQAVGANDRLRPGQMYLLSTESGGYIPDRGFVAGASTSVEPVAIEQTPTDEHYSSDTATSIGRWVALDEHLTDCTKATEAVTAALGITARHADALRTAAQWHDVGKAHEAFQRGIGAHPDDPDGPWAKSTGTGRPDYHVLTEDGQRQPRSGFRHELASALTWLAAEKSREDAQGDLIAYLIAAHHGRVRLGLRALPTEVEPPEPNRLYARGVWQGDELPQVEVDGLHLGPFRLALDLMQLGRGEHGPSWTERSHRLLEAHGPFRLAWLESLLRIADWRASAAEIQT